MKKWGVLGLLFLAACSGGIERDARTVFRYNESAGISSLDPAFARNQANIWATRQIFNTLVELDRNLEVRPSLAKEWRQEGLSYFFTLRKGVYFHQHPCFGEDSTRAVTAHDAAYSLRRLRSKELAAPGAWVLQKVQNIKALNDSVLQIDLKEAFPPFLSMLSMNYCAVVPWEAVEQYGSDFGRHPVGSGPFYFKLWVEQEKLVLRRNKRYWERDSAGEALPYLEAVAITFVPDKQAGFLEFLKGNNDLISGLDLSYKDELLDREGQLREKYRARFTVYRQPYLNTEYLGFQVDTMAGGADSVWSREPKLRQALNYCFDRKKMMRYLRNSVGQPALQGMIPPGLPAYDSTAAYGYDYDPERAAALLAEAGYPEGQGLATLTLQTNASYLDLCEYLQAEAAKVGIPLKVEVSPPSTLRQAMAIGQVAFFRGSWIADYPDAENYLSLFYSQNHSPNGPNYTHFRSVAFDALYEGSQQPLSDSTRRAMYRAMDSIVMSEAAVVPLYYDQVLRFYPKSVQGLEGNALNHLDLRRVRKGK